MNKISIETARYRLFAIILAWIAIILAWIAIKLFFMDDFSKDKTSLILDKIGVGIILLIAAIGCIYKAKALKNKTETTIRLL